MPGQRATIDDYQAFLTEPDAVWRECLRVLVPGSRPACAVGGVLAETPRLPEADRGRYADGGTSTARTSATNAGTCPASRSSSSRTDIGGRR